MNCSCLAQEPLLRQILCDDRHCLLDTRLLRVDVDLWVLRLFVRRTDAGEVLDLASTSLLVQALGITLLGLCNRDVNVDLDERQWRVGVVGRLVKCTGAVAICLVGRDEGGQGNSRGIRKELCDLKRAFVNPVVRVLLGMILSAHTSAIRRMFSFLSFSEKPRSLFNPNRTLSPSSL